MKNKTLSVIIPVYNPNIEHFTRCIESVYSQISDEIEVIIVDDASTDKSFLDVLSDKDCTILTNEKNLKAGLSRQVGLDYSKADFVTFVDQDDEFVEDTLQYMVKRLKESGCKLICRTHQLVCCDYDFRETGLCFEDESTDFLHGTFFYRQGLIDNDIRFSDTLYATEDTYFVAKVNAVAFHLNDIWLSMEERIITYRWYLWGDSTSHKPVNGGIYFLETFETFVDCHIAVIEWAKEKWNDPEYYMVRIICVLLNVYFNYQYYTFNGKIIDKVKVQAEKYKRWVLQFLDISKMELLDIINNNPELYCHEFIEFGKRNLPFVPEQSLKEWL